MECIFDNACRQLFLSLDNNRYPSFQHFIQPSGFHCAGNHSDLPAAPFLFFPQLIPHTTVPFIQPNTQISLSKLEGLISDKPDGLTTLVGMEQCLMTPWHSAPSKLFSVRNVIKKPPMREVFYIHQITKLTFLKIFQFLFLHFCFQLQQQISQQLFQPAFYHHQKNTILQY